MIAFASGEKIEKWTKPFHGRLAISFPVSESHAQRQVESMSFQLQDTATSSLPSVESRIRETCSGSSLTGSLRRNSAICPPLSAFQRRMAASPLADTKVRLSG